MHQTFCLDGNQQCLLLIKGRSTCFLNMHAINSALKRGGWVVQVQVQPYEVQVHFLEKFLIKSMFQRIMGPLLRRAIWTLPRPTGGDLFYNNRASSYSNHTTERHPTFKFILFNGIAKAKLFPWDYLMSLHVGTFWFSP